MWTFLEAVFTDSLDFFPRCFTPNTWQMKALRVTKGVNTGLLVAGVWATIEPMQSAEKKPSNGKSWDCKINFLKRSVCRPREVLIICGMVKLLVRRMVGCVTPILADYGR